MSENDQYRESDYYPNHLIDTLIAHLQLKNDAALCRHLHVARPIISRIRHRKLPVTASILLRMHEETGLSMRELRYLLGDRRRSFRFGHAHDRLSE